MTDLPLGTLLTPNGLHSGLWALPRPRTRRWGQGHELMHRLGALYGAPDIAFGVTDTIDSSITTVDSDPRSGATVVADWAKMPFADREFAYGYWDPPYLGHIGKKGDVHYRRMEPCLREITRVLSHRLVILSPLIYPCPKGWRREAVIATTMGPNKIIRALQSFVRVTA